MKSCCSLGKRKSPQKTRSEDNAIANVDGNSQQKLLVSSGSDSDESQQSTARGPAARCAIYPLFPRPRDLDWSASWVAQT